MIACGNPASIFVVQRGCKAGLASLGSVHRDDDVIDYLFHLPAAAIERSIAIGCIPPRSLVSKLSSFIAFRAPEPGDSPMSIPFVALAT